MKILFLAANPLSTTQLKLGEEVRRIEEGLESSKLRDEFELVQKWAVRSTDIRRALLKENPDLVHFSGHGKGQAGLVIMDEGEQAKPATGEALAGLFSLFPNIKCVLLNACYAEAQAQAIVQKIDYVIGMRDTILDDGAIAFTTGFYDGLGYGRSIEDAFKLGQNAILWELASFSDVTRKLIPVELTKKEPSASLPEHQKPILLKKEILSQEITENQIKEQKLGDLSLNKLKKYRETIQEYVAQQRLNRRAKFQLATLAEELEISESEANKIWSEELGKIEEAQPEPPKKKQEEIRGQQQVTTTTSLTTISRKQFLKWVGLGGGGLVTTMILSQILKKQSELTLQTIDFETVTVNDKGQEVKRKLGQAQYFTQDLGNGITLDMVSIPGGSFLMGTEESEIERLVKKFNREYFRREKPQHKVTIKPFFMGKYQVTQAQWKVLASLPKVNRDLKPDPSSFKGDDLPVETVSWEDAVEFCQRLSKQTKREYRLPSEAEWEYACRARTTTPFYFGETITGDLANYDASYTYANEPKGEYREKTTPVGNFPPNAFGLYDMHGNVWEWCEDDWHDNYEGAPKDGSAWISENDSIKVVRCGSWIEAPVFCRSAYRFSGFPDDPFISIGFRVACSVPGSL